MTTKRDRFGQLLVSVTQSVSRLERDRVCCGDLTYQQFQTLSRVQRAEGTTVKAVATDLGIDDSTASRNVSILVRDGYLGKTKDPDNARSVCLVLTPRGRNALATMTCGEQEILSAIFERVPLAVRGDLIGVLEALEAAIGEHAAPCCEPSSSGTAEGARSGKKARVGR